MEERLNPRRETIICCTLDRSNSRAFVELVVSNTWPSTNDTASPFLQFLYARAKPPAYGVRHLPKAGLAGKAGRCERGHSCNVHAGVELICFCPCLRNRYVIYYITISTLPKLISAPACLGKALYRRWRIIRQILLLASACRFQWSDRRHTSSYDVVFGSDVSQSA